MVMLYYIAKYIANFSYVNFINCDVLKLKEIDKCEDVGAIHLYDVCRNYQDEAKNEKIVYEIIKYRLFLGTLPSIIFPSNQDVLKIILEYNNQLQNLYKLLKDDALSDINKEIVNVGQLEYNDIVKLITENNTAIKNGIAKSFDQSRFSLGIRINALNNEELNETEIKLKATNTAIVKFINDTYNVLRINTSKNIDSYNASVIKNLSNAVEKGNTNVYNQVARIVNNGLDPATEIPKLIYVDPRVLEGLILAYSDQLYSIIRVDLNTAMLNINKYINTQTNSQADAQNKIATKYTASIKSSMSAELNYVLQQISIIIKNSTDTFIKQIKKDLNQYNNVLAANIKKITANLRQQMINTLKTSTSAVISLLIAKIKDNSIVTLSQIQKILAVQ